MAKAQMKHKEDFDKRVRLSMEIRELRDFLSVRMEFYGPRDKKHKHASVTEGPLWLVCVAGMTVVVRSCGK